MRINNLNGLRALAAIGILMMHYYANIHVAPDYGIVTERVIPWFTNFVFLFFIVSAFGMCCGYFEKVKAGLSPIAIYPRRYMRILPFFALLCLIDIAVSFSPEALAQTAVNLTFTNSLLPFPDGIEVIGVGWFLGVVFLFYMMFPFFVFMTHDRRSSWISLIITFILCCLGVTYFFTDTFVPTTVTLSPRTSIFCSGVFFVAGALIYHYKDAILSFTARYGIAFGLFVITLFAGYLCFYDCDNVVANWSSILIVSVLLLIACIGPDYKWLNNKVITIIGKYSFEIYLCHMMIFRFMEKSGLVDVISNPQVNYIVIVIAGLVGATIFAICFNRIWDCVKKVFVSTPPIYTTNYQELTYRSQLCAG